MQDIFSYPPRTCRVPADPLAAHSLRTCRVLAAYMLRIYPPLASDGICEFCGGSAASLATTSARTSACKNSTKLTGDFRETFGALSGNPRDTFGKSPENLLEAFGNLTCEEEPAYQRVAVTPLALLGSSAQVHPIFAPQGRVGTTTWGTKRQMVSV